VGRGEKEEYTPLHTLSGVRPRYKIHDDDGDGGGAAGGQRKERNTGAIAPKSGSGEIYRREQTGHSS